MAEWAIIKNNYVITKVVWDGVTEWDYPYPYDFKMEDTEGILNTGDWYEASEDMFYRPLGKLPPDFPIE